LFWLIGRVFEPTVMSDAKHRGTVGSVKHKLSQELAPRKLVRKRAKPASHPHYQLY
jgi:hypothetical protein